jgi:uncharacterized protein (DUF608 family)
MPPPSNISFQLIKSFYSSGTEVLSNFSDFIKYDSASSDFLLSEKSQNFRDISHFLNYSSFNIEYRSSLPLIILAYDVRDDESIGNLLK